MFKSQLLSKISVKQWLSLIMVGIFLAAPMSAYAARVFCRSDPIVFLSDGTRLQFNASIEAAREDVTGIHYFLHAPAGVTIDRIVFTPNWAREIETVELVNDQAAGNYVIVAHVSVNGPSVGVEIRAMKTAKKNGGQGSSHQTVAGNTSAPIVVSFTS